MDARLDETPQVQVQEFVHPLRGCAGMSGRDKPGYLCFGPLSGFCRLVGIAFWLAAIDVSQYYRRLLCADGLGNYVTRCRLKNLCVKLIGGPPPVVVFRLVSL